MGVRGPCPAPHIPSDLEMGDLGLQGPGEAPAGSTGQSQACWCYGLSLACFPKMTLSCTAEEGGLCLRADHHPQDLFQTPQISDVSGKKMTLSFAKSPTLEETQLRQMVNRVLTAACVLFHALILSVHKTNSAKPLEANCQRKAFWGRRISFSDGKIHLK